jgi:polyisoprenoid-binding protein YceI
MKAPLAVLAAVLAVASPALAADTYQFDKSHTTVGFEVRHVVTSVGGKFQDFSGTIRVDRARPEGSSVEFTIQAASVDTGEPKRDEHLKSPDFFDVAKEPTITFKSTSVKATGKDAYEVTGQLTMRGVTKTIALPVTFLGEGKDPWGNEKAGFELQTTLNRKDYGIVWNKTLDQGGVLLGDEVKVQISVEANKVKQTADAR